MLQLINPPLTTALHRGGAERLGCRDHAVQMMMMCTPVGAVGADAAGLMLQQVL
jgi:hypothetical protein